MRKEEYEQFWKKFPVGYRFVPEEYELIVDYLQKKEENRALPPNKISEVNVYRFNPEELAEKFKEYGEDGRYYFFTPRDKKYRNGDRPNRAAGDGYWKATGSKSPVYLKHDAALVGYKSTLVFYRGKPPKGAKTDWIMHEFRSRNPPPPRTPTPDGMRLDDYVLCEIHYKPPRNAKDKDGDRDIGKNSIMDFTEDLLDLSKFSTDFSFP